jgi:hypothetical protein
VASNIGQNYPYSSETEAERAAAVDAILAAHDGLADTVAAETAPLGVEERWWTWRCRKGGCGGVVHAAGHARDNRAVYVVCDRCGSTSLR